MTTETNEIAERDYYTPAQLAQTLQVHPQTLARRRGLDGRLGRGINHGKRCTVHLWPPSSAARKSAARHRIDCPLQGAG
jgi:hypothetical protein